MLDSLKMRRYPYFSFWISITLAKAELSTRAANREFKQIRRRRQRERHKTIVFNEQNNALHVR